MGIFLGTVARSVPKFGLALARFRRAVGETA
jgi:hypothetical protein